MDPLKPNNLPVEQSDLSFQVMPQEGEFGHAAPAGPAAVPPRPSAPSAAQRPSIPPPPYKSGATLPPPPEQNLALGEEIGEPSFFRSKWIYILGGVVVLIGLGVLAYVMLGSKKTTPPVEETVTTKLPKIWLSQYFIQNLNTDGSCNDPLICGDEADKDIDGLKNYDEFVAGTSPVSSDSDVDGLADGDEVNIYKTEPTVKYTDRRLIVSQSEWVDGFQVKNGYDPLTPGLKFTDIRKQQIADDITKFTLHEPTITTLSSLNPTNPSTAQPKTVVIQSTGFSLNLITVNKGDTVTWTNNDSVPHNVIGDTGGPASGIIAPNGTYSFTFNTAGTFAYHCSIHPTMTGTVVVQ